MSDLNYLLENNRAWAASMRERDPEFFPRIAQVQNPQFLWIGCSDSRVPANQITGLLPGEVFVHRNVANVVVHSDLNCLSAMQFGVDVLKVRHIMVVGHYGCGGVHAALHGLRFGLVDNWLRHVQDVRNKHAGLLEIFPEEQRHDRLCELNVIEQVLNVSETTIVRDAWKAGQDLTIHGWLYRLQDGLIRNLNVSTSNETELGPNYWGALTRMRALIEGEKEEAKTEEE
jgi:carbonic anhydrase